MKQQLFLLCLSISLLSITAHSCSNTAERQNKESETPKTPVQFGDPFIMLHEGTYYAYGTAGDEGIKVYTSQDLLTWENPNEQLALNKKDVWADRWFWAPEVYFANDKFYMYYSADEHICVATSDSPLGPFTQEVKEPMIVDEKCIDNSLFVDDGKAYMYFDRFNDGLNIWVVELEGNLIDMKKETLQKCINVSQGWEEIQGRVNEGPFVVKHDGLYYMTYSANHYENHSYGIGFATATSPLGPWTKYEGNPIYQKVGGLVGIGHSAMFRDKGGKLRITFHAHHSETEIHPRIMHISEVKFEKKEGKTIMAIDPNFITPELSLKKQ